MCQSLSLGLPSAELHGRRTARADPHGQWRAVCHHDLDPALEALGLVGAAGRPARVHRAGAARPEWAARTYASATTRLAAGSLAAQQRRFNEFRDEANHERPHEALDQQTPASCYAPPRPGRCRRNCLRIRWNRRWVNVSTVCIGEYVGLENLERLLRAAEAGAPARAAHAHR